MRLRKVISIVILAIAAGCSGEAGQVELLHVSYDPTRELFEAVNEKFAPAYNAQNTPKISIKQSHGGSGSQARSVIDGLEADIVSLPLWSDVDAISKKGLIDAHWEERLPNNSLPYFSTIVFVVRQGNPKQIKDWPDLVRGDVSVITPSPKTSGNGKLSFLAAWGSVLLRGGSRDDATKYVTELYKRVPVLDSGARGATTTFAQKEIGDVHLTWENEAWLEVRESGNKLEIIYPPLSIRAEPKVAVVDANVKRHATDKAAQAYLEFLFTPQGQEIAAEHYYRPIDVDVLAKHAQDFPPLELFTIEKIAPGWGEAITEFFADGAVFDQIYEAAAKGK
ncbi:MAG TPA: sulfate ABC transporter substrate-binding protein [Pirellulales bacterium]|nr:sulfate ABC transporter substrate-binding protein [Pirellulales bacterium]